MSEPRLGRYEDRGVATILVVLLMPLLVFFGAFVFDGGRGILARRQTQNAADAGALAKATDCAKGISTTNFAPYQNDGAVLANSPSCGSGVTTVTMSREINFLFRPDLPGGSATVTRSAIARWGALNSARTTPVVISQCTFDLATSGGMTFPSAVVDVPLGSGGPTCPGRPPGAFGWLNNPSSCSVQTTLNSSGQLLVQGQPGTGNHPGWNCITQVGVGGLMRVPVYGAACRDTSPCVLGQNNATGSNIYYIILGFAEFELLAWDLQHGTPGRSAGPLPCGQGSASCIRGRFLRFVTQQGSTGPATNFGGMQVYLSLS